jgi:mercuric reductase
MVERGTLGGTCVNVGCVPTKNLLGVGEIIHSCGVVGFSNSNPDFEFKRIIQRKDDLVLRLRNQKYIDVVKSMPNVELIEGKAHFKSKNEVFVNGRLLSGKNIIIATGSSATAPPIKGIADVDYLTNIEALSLEEKPESMIILGGSTLGVEFAQMFSRLGTKVTLLQRSSRIIPKEEPTISELLRSYLEEEGIAIHTGVTFQSIEKNGTYRVKGEVNGNSVEFSAEKLLMATGRRPNTADLALENAGVEVTNNGAIKVDVEMRTSVPNIFAVGDVIGEPMLETVAAKEGSIAASNALFGTNKKMDFGTVPHAVFTSPQVASVGITEDQAMQRFGTCSCRTLMMTDVPKAFVANKTGGLIKMVVDPKTQKILGVHILSDLAADIIHEAVLAVKYGLTTDDIIDTVHIFPTMSESIKLVATSFKKDIKKLSCCVE